MILHGTDTMAYTASALSFMLENLGKCIVLTGAMIPLAYPVTDAKRNLIVSLMCAVNLDIPGQCATVADSENATVICGYIVHARADCALHCLPPLSSPLSLQRYASSSTTYYYAAIGRKN